MKEMTPQAAELSPDAVEYPLGAPLSQEQLNGLADFSLGLYREWSYSETKEEYESRIESYRGAYSPDLAKEVYDGLARHYLLTNSGDEMRDYVTKSEEVFQRVLQDSLIHREEAAFIVPEAVKAITGEEAFTQRVADLSEKTPRILLGHIHDLQDVMSPEALQGVVSHAYDAMREDEGAFTYVLTSMGATISEVVGVETVREDMNALIDSGNLAESDVSVSGLVSLVEAGVVSADRVMPAVSSSIRGDSFVSMHDVYTLVQRCESPEESERAMNESFFEVLSETEPNYQHDAILSFFLDANRPGYSEAFAAQALAVTQEARGLEGLVDCVAQINDEALVNEVLMYALNEVRESVPDESGDYESRIEKMVGRLYEERENFDAATQEEIRSLYAEKSPEQMMGRLRYMPEEERRLLLGTVRQAMFRVGDNEVIRSLGIIREFFSDDLELRELVREKCVSGNGMTLRTEADALKEYFSAEEITSIFTEYLEGDQEDMRWNLPSMYAAAMQTLGVETAKDIFLGFAIENPVVGSNILDNQCITSLEDNEVVSVVRGLIDHGAASELMSNLAAISHRLPKAEMLTTLDFLYETQPEELSGRLNVLAGNVSDEVMRYMIGKVVEKNPAHLLNGADELPEGYLTKDDIIEYMRTDARTELAPKFFSKIIKQLPKADKTTAFKIMTKEAGRVYEKIGEISDGQGTEMLRRIKQTIEGGGERAELESLSLAALIVAEGIDPETIQTADQAKRVAIEDINARTGSAVDPDRLHELEARVGSIIPVSTYIRTNDYHNSLEHTAPYLGEVISHLDAGDFKEWRYGDREAFIASGILPNISEQQYARWQRNEATESIDVVADDAESVARQIQEVVSQGLTGNETLGMIAQIDNPDDALADLRKQIGGLGKQIGDVHRQKQAGVITDEMAERQVRYLEGQKQHFEVAVDIVRLSRISPKEVAEGVLYNEKGRPTKSTIEASLGDVMRQYGEEAEESFEQLSSALSNYREASTTDIGRVTIEDTDDFQTTFEIGANPVGSCQHYEHGMYKRGLVGYLEPGVKVVTVRNERDKLIARSVARLGTGTEGEPVMILEPLYTAQASDDIREVLLHHAKAKAEAMEMALYVVDEEHGEKNGITTQQHRAPYSYSDVFGGIHTRGTELPRLFKQLARV